MTGGFTLVVFMFEYMLMKHLQAYQMGFNFDYNLSLLQKGGKMTLIYNQSNTFIRRHALFSLAYAH